MQVVLIATLSCLYYVLGDFYMSTNTLLQNVLLVFWFAPLILAKHWNHTYGVFRSARQGLRGFHM